MGCEVPVDPSDCQGVGSGTFSMLWAPKRPAGVDGVVGHRQVAIGTRFVSAPSRIQISFGAVVLSRLVGHQHQPAFEQRHRA